MARAVVVFAIVFAAFGAGCSSEHDHPAFVSVERVEAAFRTAPSHLRGVVVLRNLLTPNPYGDLADYTAYPGRSSDDYDVREEIARLHVFPGVAAAETASRAIRDDRVCLAHPEEELAIL